MAGGFAVQILVDTVDAKEAAFISQRERYEAGFVTEQTTQFSNRILTSEWLQFGA